MPSRAAHRSLQLFYAPGHGPARLGLAVAFVLSAALPSLPAAAAIHGPEQAKLALAADRTAYDPGTTAHLAARVTIVPGWHVNAHKPTFEYLIPTEVVITLPAGWAAAALRYPEPKLQKFAFEPEPLAVYDDQVTIDADFALPKGVAAGSYPIRASLSYQSCNDKQCLPPVTTEARLELRVGAGGQPVPGFGGVGGIGSTGGSAGGKAGAAGSGAAGAVKRSAGRPAAGEGIFLMLALGLLGGLVLNVMPCVLPVLSLKVFGLVRSAGHGRAEVTAGALATAAGILTSFWALAGAAIAARAAGSAVGWGVQFQRPGFVVFLVLVIVLFCLNLWGLFEIPLPQRLARLGGAGPREGIAGHFASGLFASLMATPCSAPFLGTAIGFALAQKAPLILAIFTAVGLGMALPYLLLALAPGTARLLPKPGAWMENVRGVMGFLLAAAAVWLLYVLAAEVSPERLAMVEIGMLALALFAWLHHRGATPGSPGSAALRRLGAVGMVVAVLGTFALATGSETRTQSTAVKTAGLIPWVNFDRTRAESLAAAGTPVFVDVTADWCFTCKVNERAVLNTPEVAHAFAEHAVVPMRADWTNRNDEIGAFLAEHGRYGIPFYLLYLPGGEAQVFSELPSKEGLVEAVRKSTGRKIAAR
jgi:suppressor for copper-sensitivity B